MQIPARAAATLTTLLTLGAAALPAQEARSRFERMNLIRREKLDTALPGAMRDNGIDMWIHVIRRGDPDAFALDFGTTMGHIILTDRGGPRVERALFGHSFAELADASVYDTIGEESEIPAYVAARDPRRIAVNMSETLSHADGLSVTGYRRLKALLGPKYAARLVSSEGVVTDFRVRRVPSEIVAFAEACEIQRRIMEEGLRDIRPGVTTREDVAWRANDRLLAMGLEAPPYEPDLADVLHSETSGPEETGRTDYAFCPGDLISWDWGIRYLNFGTDIKRNAYLLRDGETDLPASLRKAWERGLRAREVLRGAMISGRTAGETLGRAVASLESAGFIYTPFTDTPRDAEIIQAMGDSDRSGFSIDCHCVGNTGNSEVAVGPSMAPFRPSRSLLLVQPGTLIAFELIVHTWMPEWKRRLAINLEDDSVVTERGVEALYPRNEKIILVR